MSALGSKLRQCEGSIVMFRCPGCGENHSVSVNSGIPGRDWGFNGDGDKPTFTPSVLVTGLQTVKDQHGKWTGEWVLDENGKGVPMSCHSFVTDGRIQFLTDCTHALAGQTVDLPDFPS